MKRDALKEWCRLHDFLNAAPDGAADDAARLAAQGVDVQGTVDRVKAMVRKAYQTQLREQAERERNQASAKALAVTAKVAAMPLDAVREMLRVFAVGTDAVQPRAAAVAFFRQRSADECSEEDLRSLLADIMAAEGDDAGSEDRAES